MTTENHHPITDEDIRLYLCDALSPDRRAEIRRWFGTEEGQRYLSEVIDEDVPVFCPEKNCIAQNP